MAILGINGKIGSGKDTVGQIIQYLDWYKAANSQGLSTNMSFEEWLKIKTASFPFNHKHWEIKKFAGKLKQIASILTGATLEQLEDQDFKKLEMGPEWGITYRELLQKLGTEAMRNGLHENVWVNALMADYKNGASIEIKDVNATFMGSKIESVKVKQEESKWIITDMRFPNEMEAVKAKGGITIRVNRPYSTTGGNGIPATFSQTQFHPSETALDNHEFDYVIDNNGTISDLIDKVKNILTQENLI
jgi:hypothetical protein